MKTPIREFLLENPEILKEVVQNLNSWNGSLEQLRVYDNDEEFFEVYYGDKPMEAVRATYYGDYHYNDDYVRVNGYGNLESLDESEYERLLEQEVDEVIDILLEEHDNLTLDNDLFDLIEKYEGK